MSKPTKHHVNQPEPMPTELTPIGEQYVIPGCEKTEKDGKPLRAPTFWERRR